MTAAVIGAGIILILTPRRFLIGTLKLALIFGAWYLLTRPRKRATISADGT